MQPVRLCCSTGFAACGYEEAPLIARIPKQMTGPSDVGGGLGYLGRGCGLGRLDLPRCLTDYMAITPPRVLLRRACCVALWGIYRLS